MNWSRLGRAVVYPLGMLLVGYVWFLGLVLTIIDNVTRKKEETPP